MRRIEIDGPGPPAAVVGGGTASEDMVEQAVWQDLYRERYLATVRLAGLLSGDFRVGEDLAQEAFARLFESMDAVRDPAAYLRATVVNLCRRRIRHAIVARRWTASSPPPAAEPDPGDRMATRSAVLAALRGLSRRQREAVVLRYYAGLSEAETAEAMRLSAGSVKTHLHRAMAALARDLEELR